MENYENQYKSKLTNENVVQGDYESTTMPLTEVYKLVNKGKDEEYFGYFMDQGYKNVGDVVEAIKLDKFDVDIMRGIFIDDVRVSVAIYTSSVNYLHRHGLIDVTTKEKDEFQTSKLSAFEKWKKENPNYSTETEEAWKLHMQTVEEMKVHQAEITERTQKMIDFVNSNPEMPTTEIRAKVREILGPDILKWKSDIFDPDGVPEFKKIEDILFKLGTRRIGLNKQ